MYSRGFCAKFQPTKGVNIFFVDLHLDNTGKQFGGCGLYIVDGHAWKTMTSHDHHGIELSFRIVIISGCFVVIKILFFKLHCALPQSYLIVRLECEPHYNV